MKTRLQSYRPDSDGGRRDPGAPRLRAPGQGSVEIGPELLVAAQRRAAQAGRPGHAWAAPPLPAGPPVGADGATESATGPARARRTRSISLVD